MRHYLLTLIALLALVSGAEAGKKKIPDPIPEHQGRVEVGAPALHDGAVIPLSLVDKLAVKRARPGDQVEFRVADDVRWRDRVVVQKGTVAIADVTEAQGARWPSRGSALTLTLHSVKAIDGRDVPLRAAANLKGGVNKVTGAAWALTLGTRELGLFFAPAAIVLSLTTKGHNENAPAGMHMLASVDGELPIPNLQTQTGDPSKPGIVLVGISRELYRALFYCNGMPVSRLDRGRVLRLEMPPGFYRFGTMKDTKQEIYVVGGQEQSVIIDRTGISLLASDWSDELRKRKPVKPEHRFNAVDSCRPLPEEPATAELLPKVIKSYVLIHQLSAARQEIGDIAEQ